MRNELSILRDSDSESDEEKSNVRQAQDVNDDSDDEVWQNMDKGRKRSADVSQLDEGAGKKMRKEVNLKRKSDSGDVVDVKKKKVVSRKRKAVGC